jgi:(p)ppGpp synthase/HD superfamily hydrolase
MTELQIAERIAREAHAGQKDTVTGEPYITHVERVVAMVEGDEAKAVAWLHDVLEDCPGWTGGRLEAEGVSIVVILPVLTLTRADGETYDQYIDTIARSHDPLALAVKLADLRDHLRPNCPERLRPRYERALAILSPPEAT